MVFEGGQARAEMESARAWDTRYSAQNITPEPGSDDQPPATTDCQGLKVEMVDS